MNRFHPFLNDLDTLLTESKGEKDKTYIHPALKNLGCVSIVLLRETIAPTVFRNAEAEITDIDMGGEPHIRAVPNKFKYPERGRGLQILRAFGVGGRLPQNRTVLHKNQKQSEAYDLNTMVFGDSCVQDTRVLSVKAGVNYSDAISILPKHLCVDETFHNRAMEDGTLFEAQEKKNSDNLFSRHFIKPGVLLLQTLSTRGKTLPPIGLDHLLLSIGVAGAYGGQTSVTGINVRSRILGIYGGCFEQPHSSPYEMLKQLKDENNVDAVRDTLHPWLANAHEVAMDGDEAEVHQARLIEQFEQDNDTMAGTYQTMQPKVAEFFDNWFGK